MNSAKNFNHIFQKCSQGFLFADSFIRLDLQILPSAFEVLSIQSLDIEIDSVVISVWIFHIFEFQITIKKKNFYFLRIKNKVFFQEYFQNQKTFMDKRKTLKNFPFIFF